MSSAPDIPEPLFSDRGGTPAVCSVVVISSFMLEIKPKVSSQISSSFIQTCILHMNCRSRTATVSRDLLLVCECMLSHTRHSSPWKMLIVRKNLCHGRAHWSCKNNWTTSVFLDILQSFSGLCNICLAPDIPSILHLTGRDSHNPGFVANLRTLYLQRHVIWIHSPAVSSLSAKPICFHVVFNFQCTENDRLPKEQCLQGWIVLHAVTHRRSPWDLCQRFLVYDIEEDVLVINMFFYNLSASPLSVPPGTFTPESTHTSFLRFS